MNFDYQSSEKKQKPFRSFAVSFAHKVKFYFSLPSSTTTTTTASTTSSQASKAT